MNYVGAKSGIDPLKEKCSTGVKSKYIEKGVLPQAWGKTPRGWAF
jgi:hypothetical protein